jgi:hypothetical protein
LERDENRRREWVAEKKEGKKVSLGTVGEVRIGIGAEKERALGEHKGAVSED